MPANNAVAFDQNAIGANLAVTVQNTILQTTVPATDAHRLARALYGLGSPTAKASVECYLYSPSAANPSLVSVAGVPPCCVGLVNKSASVSDFVGHDANGIGYCPGDGKVYLNNAVVATFAAVGYNTFITVVYDAQNTTVRWYSNGQLLGSYTTLAAGAWYYAATVSGNPGDMAIWANAGQTPAAYPVNGGGWYHLGIGITPAFIANEPYITAGTDVRPNQRYAGDLDRASQKISIARAITSPWFWGASKPPTLGSASSNVSIPLLDPNKIYEQYTRLDIRDQIIVIARGQLGVAAAGAEPIFTGVLDRCDQPTDQSKVLQAKGKISLLETQLIRPIFPPNADPTLAGKPRPFREGINRNFAPTPYDNTNLLFPATSSPISGLGKGRDQGVEIAYGIDWSLTADAENISRIAAPKGKTTYETTTFGGSFSASATDLLGGDGTFGSTVNDGGGKIGTSVTSFTPATGAGKVFTTNASGLPFVNGKNFRIISRGAPTAFITGTITSYVGTTLTVNALVAGGTGAHADWDIEGGVNQPHDWIGGGGYPTDPKNAIWQVRGTAPNQYVEQNHTADAMYWMQHATMTVAANAFVAYEIVVRQAPWSGPGTDVNGNAIVVTPANLMFGGEASAGVQFFTWAKFPVATASTYRGSFVNNQGVTLPLVLGFLCNPLGNGDPRILSLQITSIKLVALPAITQNLLLLGPGLDWLLQKIFVQFGPLTLADYDPTGAQAIDAATGYQMGVAYSENETPSCLAAAQPLLDTVGGSVYETRGGKISVFRLTPPEQATVVQGTLTVTNFSGYLQPYSDLAENLSSRSECTRNINPYVDSDFANVTLSQVPQAVRNLLKARYQTTSAAGVVLPTMYSYANNAAPLSSCLDLAADNQAEITRVNSMYTSPRHFYVGTVFSPFGTLYEIGQVWFVIYPTGVLVAGQNLVIVAVDEQPTEELTTLTFWGL
jgi:hypothetical protein